MCVILCYFQPDRLRCVNRVCEESAHSPLMIAVTKEALEYIIDGCFVGWGEEVFGEVIGHEVLAFTHSMCPDTLLKATGSAEIIKYLLKKKKYIFTRHCCSHSMFSFFFLILMHARYKQSQITKEQGQHKLAWTSENQWKAAQTNKV